MLKTSVVTAALLLKLLRPPFTSQIHINRVSTWDDDGDKVLIEFAPLVEGGEGPQHVDLIVDDKSVRWKPDADV